MSTPEGTPERTFKLLKCFMDELWDVTGADEGDSGNKRRLFKVDLPVTKPQGRVIDLRLLFQSAETCADKY